MIKKVFCFLFILNILLLSFTLSVSAVQGGDACAFEELEFEEYLALIDAIAESMEYPHYFAENTERYKAFQERHPDMPFDTVIALVNVNNDMEGYRYVDIVTEPDELYVLLNKNFALPPNWEPSELVNVRHGFLARPEAAEYFDKMIAAMREDNLNLVIVSTYRSIARQRNLFNNAAASRGVQRAERSIARPGHSEHNTGLAIDVLHRGATGSLSSMRFENTSQFSWLVDNAHQYGFILRYPLGYTQISGYIFEPWHWRYVGIPIATAMHSRGIVSYEDFYGRFLIQSMRDRVSEYIFEQQRLAEEAEAAALLAAEEAAALAAADAAARLAAEEAAEAELLRIEAMIRDTTQTAAAEARASAEVAVAELDALVGYVFYSNMRFTVILSILVLSAAAAVLLVAEPRLRESRLRGFSPVLRRRQGNGSIPNPSESASSGGACEVRAAGGEFVLCRTKAYSGITFRQYLQAKLAFAVFKKVHRFTQ
jgi:LAS superfamily LD-carboxypeptidase LdcB